MSRVAQFRLVVGREVSESFRRTSVRALVGILFLASIAGVVAPEIIGGSGRPDYDLYLDDALPAGTTDAIQASATSAEVDVEFISKEQLTAGPRLAVRDGEVDAAVLSGEPPLIVTEDDRSDELAAVLTRGVSPSVLAQRLESVGVDGDEAADLASRPTVRFESVSTSDASERRGVGTLASTVLYFTILTVAVQVANGTAIEKSSRISEVLLAVVRPGTLLFGKVVGVGLVSLAGVVALVVPVLAKMVLGGSLPSGALSTIGVAFLWFVLGMALWAPLAGMFGSMVERQEEVGTAMQPITLVLVGAFIVATSAPDSLLGTVLAYVPFTSPIIEPLRIAMGVATPGEAVISAGVLVVGAVAAIRLGGVVHKRAVVRTGRRLRFRDLV